MFKAGSAGRIEHTKVCGAGCGNGSGYAAWLKCWSSQLLARSGKVRKKANAFLLEMVVDVVALEGSVMCIKFLISRALIIKHLLCLGRGFEVRCMAGSTTWREMPPGLHQSVATTKELR